jgi:Holliday junction DNA helicase RuvA
VGIKTAQRLVVELRDTLKKTSAGEIPLAGARSSVMDEALAAMTTLGFARPAAEKVISKIMNEKQEQVTVEELIKQALKAI